MRTVFGMSGDPERECQGLTSKSSSKHLQFRCIFSSMSLKSVLDM